MRWFTVLVRKNKKEKKLSGFFAKRFFSKGQVYKLYFKIWLTWIFLFLYVYKQYFINFPFFNKILKTVPRLLTIINNSKNLGNESIQK